MFKLQRTRIQNTQFVVFISVTSVTLKRSQSHQIKNNNVDPKKGYNHAKFERSCFSVVSEKKQFDSFFVCFFQTRKYVNYFSLNMRENQKWRYIYDLLNVINTHTKFQLNRIRTYNFQFKLSSTAVTLKYNQDH